MLQISQRPDHVGTCSGHDNERVVNLCRDRSQILIVERRQRPAVPQPIDLEPLRIRSCVVVKLLHILLLSDALYRRTLVIEFPGQRLVLERLEVHRLPCIRACVGVVELFDLVSPVVDIRDTADVDRLGNLVPRPDLNRHEPPFGANHYPHRRRYSPSHVIRDVDKPCLRVELVGIQRAQPVVERLTQNLRFRILTLPPRGFRGCYRRQQIRLAGSVAPIQGVGRPDFPLLPFDVPVEVVVLPVDRVQNLRIARADIPRGVVRAGSEVDDNQRGVLRDLHGRPAEALNRDGVADRRNLLGLRDGIQRVTADPINRLIVIIRADFRNTLPREINRRAVVYEFPAVVLLLNLGLLGFFEQLLRPG